MFMFGFGQDIGIDLREPSVVAVNNNTGEVLAIGQEARRMLRKNTR